MRTKLNNGTDYKELEIKVNYSLGGINYFSGNTNPRGYYLHLTPLSITEMADGTKIMSCTLMGDKKTSGFKVIIEETKRKSQKRLDELNNKFDEKVETIRDMFEKEHYKDIFRLVNN